MRYEDFLKGTTSGAEEDIAEVVRHIERQAKDVQALDKMVKHFDAGIRAELEKVARHEKCIANHKRAINTWRRNRAALLAAIQTMRDDTQGFDPEE